MWPKITTNYSPNFNLPKRTKKSIKFIILHYTGMRKESSAIKKLCDFNSKVSAHYFIKKNGNILNLVPDLYEAWHAGKSSWKKFKSINKYSVGIEIQNSGHYYSYEKFSIKQINSLKKLIKKLIKIYKINRKNILGHSDISPNRKKDPGEKFPWKLLYKKKIGIWYNISSEQIKPLRGKILRSNFNKFFNFLKKIGYNIKSSNLSERRKIIKAFQMRFRPELTDGKIDYECFNIAKSLTNLK